MGKDRDVDAVLRKCACVLGQAELCEPISCIAAHARLISALWTRWMDDFTRLIAPREIDPNGSAAGLTGGQPEEPQTEAGPEYAMARPDNWHRLHFQPPATAFASITPPPLR
jgi:hypothetical protein